MEANLFRQLLIPRGALTPHSHAQAYRPEIDGVRAIAVLAVVLYHFGVPGLQGAFVGVDVFFVLSGYLIGGLLWAEYRATGTVSLWQFYMRRFKRLMPAFALMVLVTGAVAWLILLPFEFREFGKTIVAATVYLSNFLFYRDAGYFDAASEDKILLHTWSLAVEEQFYIFLPLFILLLARIRWLIVPTLVLLSIGSLAACIWVTRLDQPATFFLFPFRAWELLSGVLLAIAGQRFGLRFAGPLLGSLLGLGLILASFVLIAPDDRFPGYFAIMPVLGTLLLLACGRSDNLVNRMLRSPGVVFFGLISYALYLWHWPVFTLGSYLRGGALGPVEAAFGIALSVLLAWISWRLVEWPLRRAQWFRGWMVLGTTVVASGGLIAFGGYLFQRDGLAERFDAEVQPHISASADFLQDWSRCTVPAEGPLMGLEICPIRPEGQAKILVWGDSHVRAFKEGLDLAAHEAGTPGLLIWRAGCPPLFDVRKTESYATPLEDLACTNATLQLRQAFDRLPDLSHVVLIGRWSYYAHGTGEGLDKTNEILVLPDGAALTEGTPQTEVVARALTETVRALYQRFETVHVVRQPPELAYYDSRRAAREAAHDGYLFAAQPVTRPTIPLAEAAARSRPVDTVLFELAQAGWIDLIDPWPFFCAEDTCHAIREGTGLFFDNNHITNSAALMLRDYFRQVFGPVLASEARP